MSSNKSASVPPGGNPGEVLVKASADNFDIRWQALSSGGDDSGDTPSVEGSSIPAGLISMWFGDASSVPSGWAVCDGNNGTPDLRDRFVLCAGTKYAVGATGGSEEVTLTVAQMPKHAHNLLVPYRTAQSETKNHLIEPTSWDWATDNNWRGLAGVDDMGGSNPHPNMPPYYALLFIMKL